MHGTRLHSCPRRRAARQQRGTTLLFALITLVALMMATLGLVRSVDTGAMLLGNIGFKQDATASADRATRQAIKWISDNRSALNIDVAEGGYYASTQEFAANGSTARPPVDATGKQLQGVVSRQLIDWDGDECDAAEAGSYTDCSIRATSAGTINGNQASFVVFRLCSKAGDYSTDTSINCAKPLSTSNSTASGRGDLTYAESGRFNSTSGPYYRIVVRVLGARNTASFTETIVHF
jgi:type IV pilus assembly protein PilX